MITSRARATVKKRPKVLKYAQEEGWDVDLSQNGHLKLTKGDQMVFLSGTPGDFRSDKKALCDLRRADRAMLATTETDVTNPSIITYKEAAEILGRAYKTISSLVSTGVLKKEGRGFVSRESVLAYRMRTQERTLEMELAAMTEPEVLPEPPTEEETTTQTPSQPEKEVTPEDGSGPWLKVDEAATMAGISYYTMRKLIDDGDIPAKNVGTRSQKHWRIRLSVIQALMDADAALQKQMEEEADQPSDIEKAVDDLVESTKEREQIQASVVRQIAQLEVLVLMLPEGLQEKGKDAIGFLDLHLQDLGVIPKE